jgi:CRISPR type IV-associated protein Csf3
MFRNQALRNYHRPKRDSFEPLKITAQLQTAVIGDVFLPIDGILYYQAHREAFGAQEVTFSGSSDKRYEISSEALPLARCEEHGPYWYYAASFAQWPTALAEGSDHWNKRFDAGLSDMVDFGKRKARVDVASGPYKAYHMPVFYRHALEISWYVLGERRGVERLLSCCTHIGKKMAQGWGSVLAWNVAPHHADWSVRGENGKVMRAIPDASGILTGFRPSYWLAKNQTVCLLPG